ncbi:MAG: hypothetical protein IJN88_07325 [Clostridia bacterium]|nr:hypothetical protein [Clostridia bacterium]
MENLDALSRLLYDLKALQYDYSDCNGSHGPVIKEFTQILNRYHSNYYFWKPFNPSAVYDSAPVGKDNFQKTAKVCGVMVAIALLFNLLFDNLFVLMGFYTIAGIVYSKYTKNAMWWLSSVTLNAALFIVMLAAGKNLLAVSAVVFIVSTGAIFCLSLKNHFTVKAQRERYSVNYDEAEKRSETVAEELKRDRERMTELLPALYEEFRQVRKVLVENNGHLLSEKEREFLCSELPPLFWWQILPWDLDEAIKEIEPETQGTEVLWETRWVNRTAGMEYADAGSEYSPLNEVVGTVEEYKSAYDMQKADFLQEDSDAGVFDFISRGTSSYGVQEEYSYEEYEFSDFNRFGKKLLWAGVGMDIDQAHKDGSITEDQFRRLRNEYIFASGAVYDAIDSKIEKQAVKYRQVKSHINIWTGQMLLANDNLSDGIAIIDYRCQIPHIFKNIEALRDVKITRVLGDPAFRDPVVMAKIHRECELCR